MDELARKKTDMLQRLRRVEGQLRGIQGMIEKDADCEKVAQQLAASRRALDKVFFRTVACALERDVASNPAELAHIEKYTDLLARYG